MDLRKVYGLYGLIKGVGAGVIIGIIGVVLLFTEAWMIGVGVCLFGVGISGLSVFSYLRGTQGQSQSGFSSNDPMHPETETYVRPRHGMDAPETIQVESSYGGIRKAGWTFSFLGKKTTNNPENGLIVTKEGLLFLSLGPDVVSAYGGGAFAQVLDILPGDSTQKRDMYATLGASQIKQTIDVIIQKGELKQVMGKCFHYFLPFSQMKSVHRRSWLGWLEISYDDVTYRYGLRYPSDLKDVATRISTCAPTLIH